MYETGSRNFVRWTEQTPVHWRILVRTPPLSTTNGPHWPPPASLAFWCVRLTASKLLVFAFRNVRAFTHQPGRFFLLIQQFWVFASDASGVPHCRASWEKWTCIIRQPFLRPVAYDLKVMGNNYSPALHLGSSFRSRAASGCSPNYRTKRQNYWT